MNQSTQFKNKYLSCESISFSSFGDCFMKYLSCVSRILIRVFTVCALSICVPCRSFLKVDFTIFFIENIINLRIVEYSLCGIYRGKCKESPGVKRRAKEPRP